MRNHTQGEWVTSPDAVPPWHVQITVYAETGGRGTRVATVFENQDNADLVAAAPALLRECDKLREALREISTRGPVEGYRSKSALMLRLVGTQSIARAALKECEVEV